MPTISIPQYFADVFNLPIVLPVSQFIPPTPALNIDIRNKDVGFASNKAEATVRTYEGQSQRKSRFGTLIYESLELYNQDGSLLYRFPDAVLIEATDNSKNIVKTPIQGRDGTVKEYIGMDDWRIKIMGVLINSTSKDYPEDLVSELSRVYERKESLKVEGSNLCTMGIHQLVFTNISFPRKHGYPSLQPFIIEALSDEPIELEISNS
jgi:hypothetical protein